MDSMIPILRPETAVYHAAVLEGLQAERDASEQWAVVQASFVGDSIAECAYVNRIAYADTAWRAVYDLPVWEQNPS